MPRCDTEAMNLHLAEIATQVRMTPAMAANVSSRLWSLEELVDRTSR
jgi:hypothetical protein